MEKNKKSGFSGMGNAHATVDIVENGVSGRVIGGGTAVIRGKKPIFTESKMKKTVGEEIITDPLGSWTGVPADDPYERPIQDADDL